MPAGNPRHQHLPCLFYRNSSNVVATPLLLSISLYKEEVGFVAATITTELSFTLKDKVFRCSGNQNYLYFLSLYLVVISASLFFAPAV